MKKVLKRQVMAALAVTALLGAVCPAVQAEDIVVDNKAMNVFGGKTATADVSQSAPGTDLSDSQEAGKANITMQLGAGETASNIYGGGDALALTTNKQSAFDVEAKTVTAGADINLMSGTADSVYGGGGAVAYNWANASAEMTDTVNIHIDGATVNGVFGNGLALGTGTADNGNNSTWGLTGLATVSAVDTNINMQSGTVAGIIGGGVALDDTEAQNTNAFATTSGTASINVNGGTVSRLPSSSLFASAAGIADAAGDAAIAAGGVAYGGGAVADVANAVVNINGGEVNGDIYGGGIAAYGWNGVGGSHVGNSTINLNGGKVVGDVYAGGAASSTDLKENGGYIHATATVDTAVINLAGTEVTGILYGVGTVDGKVNGGTSTASSTVKNSTLNLIGTNELGLVGEAGLESSKIQSFDAVNFKAGSETVVTNANSTTALIDGKGVAKVTVEDGARLNLTKLEPAAADQTYQIAANTVKDSTFWSNDALIYDRTSGYYAEGTADGGNYNVTYSKIEGTDDVEKAADSMAAALGARSLLGMFREGMSNDWQGFGAAQTYLQDWSKAEDPTAGQKGMLIGEDAAVTGNTVSIARDMADNVMQRLSFTDDYVQDAGWVNENGGLWAKYIHRTYDTDGMGSSMGGIHSSTDYDGVIVGMDFGKSGKFQSGVAFHYGSGDGHGLVSRNDYDAWGITMYGSMKDEAAGTNLMADIGWMTSDNDIDGTVNGSSMSADRDVDAWTIGLRGEKEYVFGRNQLVPYVGLRYMSVNPGRYTAYYNGQAAFDYDADNQNLWMLPIGVSFRNETVTAGGWRITPKVDLSYIWAFGDTDTDMTVNAGSASSTLYYDVMDDSSWLASLGVEASKDVWSFGLGYGYQKGDDEKNRTWFVNASYAF